MQWSLMVVEDDDHYIYHFDSWAEVLARLAKFDGYSVEYSITHSQKAPARGTVLAPGNSLELG